jgi:hypothetical protein
MTGFSRRNFLKLTGSAAAAALTGSANAAMGPNDKFDLIVKGGDVLDPSQSLRGKRDIGIRWGVIEAVENDIPAARAAKTIDATGKLVTPGLIDMHSHIYPYGSAIGIPPTSSRNSSARPRWSPPAMRASTTSPHCAATSSRNRGRASTLSSTLPITGCPDSRSLSSTTSTMRR